MFALEIQFQDGVSEPEMVHVRRPQVLVGASDHAHLVIEDMRSLGYQLRLVREVGRKFRCLAVDVTGNEPISQALNRSYEGQAELDLGPVKFRVTALDVDLALRDGEPPDKAGVRVLRLASDSVSPRYPAILVRGNTPMIVSFDPEQPIYIGRSKQCAVRLDAADISAKHARIGYEDGHFWIEDLGSTNGTFVNGQQVAGRVTVPAGTLIVLGREITVTGVLSEDDVTQFGRAEGSGANLVPVPDRAYPALVSLSEAVRPARLVLPSNATVNLGRDPSSDMWIGAPHVSRQHSSLTLSENGLVSIGDNSTNGTMVGSNLLKRGDVLGISGKPLVLDFGNGVTVALCFSEHDEQEFTAAQGSPKTFGKGGDSSPRMTGGQMAPTRERSTTSTFGEMNSVAYRQRGLVTRLAELYRSSGFRGRITLIMFIVLVLMFVGVLGVLLAQVFYR